MGGGLGGLCDTATTYAFRQVLFFSVKPVNGTFWYMVSRDKPLKSVRGTVHGGHKRPADPILLSSFLASTCRVVTYFSSLGPRPLSLPTWHAPLLFTHGSVPICSCKPDADLVRVAFIHSSCTFQRLVSVSVFISFYVFPFPGIQAHHDYEPRNAYIPSRSRYVCRIQRFKEQVVLWWAAAQHWLGSRRRLWDVSPWWRPRN